MCRVNRVDVPYLCTVYPGRRVRRGVQQWRHRRAARGERGDLLQLLHHRELLTTNKTTSSSSSSSSPPASSPSACQHHHPHHLQLAFDGSCPPILTADYSSAQATAPPFRLPQFAFFCFIWIAAGPAPPSTIFLI